MSKEHHKWLVELTALPVAPAREACVIEWVRRWAARRRNVVLRADRFGNLLLRRKSAAAPRGRPIIFTAHMDHPAFVVTRVLGPRTLEADFRGGVEDRFFRRAAVLLHRPGRPPQPGLVTELRPASADRPDRSVTVAFERDVLAAPGDVMTWHLGRLGITRDRLRARACDDLAGVVAALAAFDLCLAKRNLRDDVRVLLTRAEEVGFLGAIAAAKARSVPRNARLFALETSRSFPDSPLGAGPVIRVGDRTATFDPDLTWRLGRIAEDLARRDPRFRWQRKLMPGGTCEASAYQAYGLASAALCLPLGNYHNMNRDAGRIDAETIDLSDFDGLVRLLVAVAESLDDQQKFPPFRKRLDAIFASRRQLLFDARPGG